MGAVPEPSSEVAASEHRCAEQCHAALRERLGEQPGAWDVPGGSGAPHSGSRRGMSSVSLPVGIFKCQMFGPQNTPVHCGKIQNSLCDSTLVTVHGPSGKTMRCTFRCLPSLLSPFFSSQMYFYAAYVFREAGIPEDTIPYVVIGTGSCELITSVTCVRLSVHSGDVQPLWAGRRLFITNLGVTLFFMPRKPFRHRSQAVCQHPQPG